MSAKRKPLNAEEKKAILLNLLHSCAQPLNKAELEAQGSRLGVVEKTVMENVSALVDDRLVSTEKIGSGVFWFSFPATALLSLRSRVDALQLNVDDETGAAAAAAARLAQLSSDTAGASALSASRAELATLKARALVLEAKVKASEDVDPDVGRTLLKRVKAAKTGADRWTDNVLSLKGFLVKKYAMEPKQAQTMLGMSDDFDYPT
jgi:hypothetical protein